MVLMYRGYRGKVEVDVDSGRLYGFVLDIQDMIAYEGSSDEELEGDFRGAIDDYLEYCRELGENPG